MTMIGGNQLRGHLETMVLAVLERNPAHGFEIMQHINEKGSGALRMKEGTLYPALYRLEKAGLVSAEWEGNATARSGPRRRVYRLTTKGRKKLAKSREDWRQFVSVIGGIVEAGP